MSQPRRLFAPDLQETGHQVLPRIYNSLGQGSSARGYNIICAEIVFGQPRRIFVPDLQETVAMTVEQYYHTRVT